MKQQHHELGDLFKGFDELYAITYSSGIDFNQEHIKPMECSLPNRQSEMKHTQRNMKTAENNDHKQKAED